MIGRNANQISEATIHFGNLNFVLNGEEEMGRALEARPLPPRSLNTIARAHGGPRVILNPEAITCFGSLNFIISNNDEMV